MQDNFYIELGSTEVCYTASSEPLPDKELLFKFTFGDETPKKAYECMLLRSIPKKVLDEASETRAVYIYRG